MDCFLTLQNQLFEQLNSLWESDDEEILEKIDELLLQEGSNYGLSLNEKANLRKELFRSIRKLDVLQELLEDTSITEIMVNGWDKIFIEREGHLITWNKTFTSSGKLEDVIQQMLPAVTVSLIPCIRLWMQDWKTVPVSMQSFRRFLWMVRF